MVVKSIDNFDLGQICRSGQCFRVTASGERRFCILAGAKRLEAEQRGEICTFFCEKREFEDFWKDYFDLGLDYGAFLDQINPRDGYLKEAASCGSGIRILRQELWEVLVSFLISQQNHIARIRRCIENICEVYGERLPDGRGGYYCAFPRPEALAGLPEEGLTDCNLGYRSKYVVRAAKSVLSGDFDLEAVKDMPYKKAREELLRLYGVGEKVADCICLFGLHHLQAFPVDTHIRQALDIHYRRGFPHRRYAKIKGIMQQYIFYYELYHSRR